MSDKKTPQDKIWICFVFYKVTDKLCIRLCTVFVEFRL